MADAAARTAVFLGLVYAARVLGPAGFGEFALVYAAAQITALLADMGLTTLVLRQGARSGRVHRASFWTAMELNIAASLVFTLGLVGAFAVAHPSATAVAAVYVPTLLMLTVTTSLETAAIAARRPVRAAGCRLAGNSVTLGLAVLLLALRPAPESVAVAFLAGAVVKLACIAVATRSLVPERRARPRLVAPLLRRGAPFYGSAIAAFLYQRVDVLFIGALAGVAAAGEYAAAYRILDGVLLLPVATVAAFLPAWTARRRTDGGHGGAGAVVVLLVCVGVLAGAELFLAREAIIGFLYGGEYDASVGVLAVLALSVPLFYADVALVWIAYARGKERRVAVLGTVALVTNIGLNLFLIRALGAVGAAIATVVTEAVIGAGYAVTLGFHRRAVRARALRLLGAAFLYAAPILALVGICITVDLSWALSCLATAATGSALLAMVYRRVVVAPS